MSVSKTKQKLNALHRLDLKKVITTSKTLISVYKEGHSGSTATGTEKAFNFKELFYTVKHTADFSESKLFLNIVCLLSLL